MINALLQKIRPFARSIKYGRLLRKAQSDATKRDVPSINPPVSFIFGCGRSGTTILGKLLATHDEVCYLFEPYHIWRAILPSTDMIQLYGMNENGTHCILESESVNETVTQRFNACMQSELQRSGTPQQRLIEKTPINAMRIQFLRGISSQSPMLHLVRNGTDVIRSIERLASTNTYQMSGKGQWNQWWGRDNCKWDSLASDAIDHGIFPEEIQQLKTHAQMGALEWLVSLIQVDSQRESLGEQLLEICYNNLTENPQEQLTKMCNHFHIESNQSWLDYCCEQLDSARKNDGEQVVLPPNMCSAFNAFQEQYGFDGRAITA